MSRANLAHPWEALPPEVAAVLRPELEALSDEIINAVRETVPDYARPLEGPFGLGLRAGVEEALRQFVEVIERPADARSEGREIYVNLGRGEMRQGRSLDALLAAYRAGARVAWRRLAAAGTRAGLAPETLYLLAESIFAYIDELSAESAEGYAREQSAAAGEAERRRRRVVTLAIQDPPSDPAAVEAAAAEAGWELPRTLAAVVFEMDAGRRSAALPGDAIAAPIGELICALVPDPDRPGRRAELERGLGEIDCALGPTVSRTRAGLSFRRAADVLRLIGDELLPGGRMVVADDHITTLFLHRDRELGQELERRLAPLDDETAASRARLRATLETWLRHQGRLRDVAAALHVHPQTVRYRLARLRELFGEQLDDPDCRFELELALRVAENTSADGDRPVSEEKLRA